MSHKFGVMLKRVHVSRRGKFFMAAKSHIEFYEWKNKTCSIFSEKLGSDVKDRHPADINSEEEVKCFYIGLL